MRVPAISNAQLTAKSLCFEPTFVLDLCSPISSSSSSDKHIPTTVTQTPKDHGDAYETETHWDEHVLHALDWDSIMKDLGLSEEPSNNHLTKSEGVTATDSPDFGNPNSVHFYDHAQLVIPTYSEVYSGMGIPHPLQPQHYPGGGGGYGEADGGGFDVLEDLIQVSDCIDSKGFQLAQAILARLNQRLRFPASGKPIHRAAFYFKEALNSLLLGATPNGPNPSRFSSWKEIVQNIRTFKAFSGVSPVAMFTHFTANQALLEAIDAAPAGWTAIFHVIDFDLGFGGQYASLLKEIAERSEFCKSPSPFVRVTAVITEEFAVESRLIKENLTQYANEVKVRISIDFVLVRAFEMTSFKSIHFVDGEVLAIHLSPAICGRLGSTTNAVRFVNDIKKLSPAVVVFVESEPWVSARGGGPASFRTNFVNCLEFYATLFESIDAAVGCGGDGNNDWAVQIECCLMQPRIEAAVEWCARREWPPWREVFLEAGLRGVRMSQFADFQAELLLGKVQVRGFHVAKRQGELVLCWHNRPLVSTSAWRF